MVTRLTTGLVIAGALTTVASLAVFSLVPPENFSSLLFWIGFGVNFIIGAFLIQSLNSKVTRIGAMAFGAWEFGLIYASYEIPAAEILASGFPGFFVGIFVVGLYSGLARSKIAYCPVCGRKTAMERRNAAGRPSIWRNGVWYCLEGKHILGQNGNKPLIEATPS